MTNNPERGLVANTKCLMAAQSPRRVKIRREPLTEALLRGLFHISESKMEKTPWEVLALRLVNVAVKHGARKAQMHRVKHEVFGLEARAKFKEERHEDGRHVSH